MLSAMIDLARSTTMDYTDLPAGNPVGDLPAALNHVLFGGDPSTLIAAQGFLAMLIMISVGAVLAMGKAPPLGFLIVEGGVLVCLVLIGWLNVWILLFISVIVMFVMAAKWAREVTGNQGVS